MKQEQKKIKCPTCGNAKFKTVEKDKFYQCRVCGDVCDDQKGKQNNG
jgi:uncharacterized Zn finger protein